MKKIEYKVKMIEKQYEKVVAEIRCDMCGELAVDPANGYWDNNTYTSTTKTEMYYRYYLDGDDCGDDLDLCHKCMSWLIERIRNKKIARPCIESEAFDTGLIQEDKNS